MSAVGRETATTRDRIVAAVRAAFAGAGYSVVGIREIAARAGVTSALISRYFGSKAGLFEAALDEAIVSPLPKHDPHDYGRLLVATVADPDAGIDVPAMISLALGDPDARPIAERIVRARIIEPMAAWLGPPDAEARAETLFMLGTGFALLRRHLDLGTGPAAVRRANALVADVVQGLVDRD